MINKLDWQLLRDDFVKQDYAVDFFFDLGKTYDTTWRHDIMKYVHKLGLRGRLPIFIERFLTYRTMQVRVGPYLSDKYDQEEGRCTNYNYFIIKILLKSLGN